MGYDRILNNVLNTDKSDNLQVEVAFSKYKREKQPRTPINMTPGTINPDFNIGNSNSSNGMDNSRPGNGGGYEPPLTPGGGNQDNNIGNSNSSNGMDNSRPDTGSNYNPILTPGTNNSGFGQYYDGIDKSKLLSKKVNEATYYNAPLVNADPKIVKEILSAEQKVSDSRRNVPPEYNDYIQYPNRVNNNYTAFRLGDVQFNVPPEFISVTETTPTESVNSLRQRGSLKIKRGYTRRSITVQLFVNGAEQINGYEVNSPFNRYYVDGIRPLFAQFITTPFVPVYNEYLNNEYNIFTVAVSGILITTLDGFPGCYEVHLSLEQITLTPYTEVPDCLYEDIINWDLYRFNYQRLLSEYTPKVKTFLPKMKNHRDSKFKLKILNQEILNGAKDFENREVSETIYDDKNFDVMLNTEEQGFEVTGISITASNNIPLMQLNSQNIPTAQYLGSSDIGFNLVIQTTDRDVIHSLETANNLSQFMARQNKEFGTFGFLKVENELINMVGVDYIIIDSLEIATVPNFPGLYNITVACTEYDYRQKEREKLVGMTPFHDRKGFKEDAISQDGIGLLNKIQQENTIETKMTRVELYPDLHLPLYDEVDEAIKKINKFRANHNLAPMNMDSLDKSFSITPGKGPVGGYGLYVDPDYYVNYPLDYRNLNDSIFDEIKGPKEAKPVTTVGKTIQYGEDLPDGSYIDENGVVHYATAGSPSSSNGGGNYDYDTETGNALADILISKCKEGCGYVFGSDGQIATSGKWKGKQVFDCSGFISWGLRELGLMTGRTNDAGLMSSTYSTRISKSELKPGDFVRFVGHIGVYIGNNKIVEAANSEAGVRIGNLYSKFNEFARPKNVGNSKNRSMNSDSKKTLRRPTVGTNGNESGAYDTPYDVSRTKINQLNRFLSNKLANTAEYFVKYGHKYNVNPVFVMSISKLETGHGKVITNNNPGGLMGKNGLISYPSIEAGIDAMTKNLRKLYLDMGLDTIPKVGAKYCPVGASNDPTGLNVNWIPSVTAIYKEIAGGPPTSLEYKGFGDVNPNYSGGSGASGGSSQTVETIKNQWTGKTIGDTVLKLDSKNFGRPIVRESPAMYIIKHDSKAKELEDRMNFVSRYMNATTGSHFLIAEKSYQALGHDLANGGLKIIWEDVQKDIGDVMGYGIKKESSFVSKRYDEMIKNFYGNSLLIYKTMYTDMMMYSKTGTMCRAFPTYSFLIADDSGDWLDARRLWSNFYIYKSIISIDIHQERSQPVHTAKITATNVHHNLNSKKTNQELKNNIQNDPEYGWLVKEFYKLSGVLIGTPKLTNSMVEVKNQLYELINLKAGARIHIRLGYGSNPLMLPVCFNGVISEINNGDVVEIVAESFGVELINGILSSDEEDVNTIFNIGSEPTNVIYSALAERDGTFANMLSKKWGESSRYGIENFGLVRDYTRIKLFEDSAKNYDQMKNVYFARYDCIPFCKGALLNFDGEDNVNFYLYNKTPWDAFQVITQSLPEFVCQPMYHQFDCRLFFGLPYALSYYRYDINKETIYDSAKSFAQFHYIDSLSNIIDNRVLSTTQDLTTNCIAMYTLGEGVKSSPTVYSDRTIYPSYQKTRTIDTTLVQDYFGWDWLYEKTFAPIAKSAAINMATSTLIDSWNRNYTGEVIIIGNSCIKPCDYLYINDMYSKMEGLTTVREVVHSINSKGFTTSVYPDMIAINTMKYSGQGNIVKSLTSFGASYGAVKTSRQAIVDCVEPYTTSISVFRGLGALRYDSPVLYSAMVAGMDIKLGKYILNSMKNAEIVKDFTKYSKAVAGFAKKGISIVNGLDAVNKAKNLKYVKPVIAGLKGAGLKLAGWGTLIAPGIGTIVGWAVGSIFIDVLLGAIIDEFSYNNTVKVFPMYYKDGPFISGCSGQANLIAGVAETSDVDENGKKMPEDKD